MSQLEHRVSQEMHAMAQRIAPGDLRPLRPPPPSAWPGNPGYWLGPAAVVAAFVLLTSGLFVVRHVLYGHQPPVRGTARMTVPDPAVVAVSDSAHQVRLLSAATGRLVKLVQVANEGNGIALAPDAKSMFVVGPSLALSQVTIATGQARLIDVGAYPAVSPDSRYLAYATGVSFTQVAVRDLYSGRTRAISLAPLLGASSSLLNQGGLTWLGNGSQIVAVSEPDPIATYVLPARPPAVHRPRRTACGQQSSPHGLCVIVINVAPKRLYARRIFLPRVAAQQNLDLISGDLATAATFYVGQSGGRPPAVINRVALDGWTPQVRRLVTLPPRTFAAVMAPDGDRVVYVRTGSAPSLWMATVRGARLVYRFRLLADTRRFEFNLIAW